METDDVRQDVWIWGGLKELSLLASLQLALGVGTGAAPQSDGTSSLLDPDTWEETWLQRFPWFLV